MDNGSPHSLFDALALAGTARLRLALLPKLCFPQTVQQMPTNKTAR